MAKIQKEILSASHDENNYTYTSTEYTRNNLKITYDYKITILLQTQTVT